MSTEYSMGVLKPTNIEFKISSLDRNIFLTMGLNSYSLRVPFLFKASIFQSGSTKKLPVSLSITGDILALEMGDFESAKEMEVSIKMSAHFINLTIDGIPTILKDVENMICLIGGVDYMANVRANLGE